MAAKQETRVVSEELRGPVVSWNPFPDIAADEVVEEPYSPIPGAVYEVLHSKLGPSPRFGFKGEQLKAEDHPRINFEQLARSGAVRRVDGAPTFTPADPAVVQVAQPHREVDSVPTA